MISEGYALSEPLDGYPSTEPDTPDPWWTRLWFNAADSGVPRTAAAVEVHVERHRDGGVMVSGSASLVSAEIDEIVRGLIGLAPTRSKTIDTISFGAFDDPPAPLADFEVTHRDFIDEFLAYFMGHVCGGVAEWFARRGSLDVLLVTARQPATVEWDDNPDPVVVRATVVLCVLEGRVADAVDLMAWYLGRSEFHRDDSLEAASAFDAAVAQRFPAYAQARASIGG